MRFPFHMISMASLALFLLLVWTRPAEPSLAPQEPQATIRSEVALVNIVFSAVDRKKRIVSDLQKHDFRIYEDRTPQEILYFSDLSEAAEIPLTIALLIDTSGSVKDKLEYEKRTASEFFSKVLRKNKDLALIIQFDSEVNLVQDFTDDQERLLGALDSLRAGNSTSLYDAVFLAVEEKLRHETGRKVVIAITDGEDTASKIDKKLAVETAQKSDVLIYGIGVRGGYGANFGVLKNFAQETGGRFFSPRSRFSEIQAAFQAINEDLKGQYSVAYVSNNKKRDGSFRSIKLQCKRKGVKIRARKGYYAPSS